MNHWQIRINATTPEKANDEIVEAWFDSRVDRTPNVLADLVQEMIDYITYKINPKDHTVPPQSLMLQMINALVKCNGSAVVKDKDQSKELIKEMARKLEPLELSQRAQDVMLLRTANKTSDIKVFATKVSQIAEQVIADQAAGTKLKRISPSTNGGQQNSMAARPIN